MKYQIEHIFRSNLNDEIDELETKLLLNKKPLVLITTFAPSIKECERQKWRKDYLILRVRIKAFHKNIKKNKIKFNKSRTLQKEYKDQAIQLDLGPKNVYSVLQSIVIEWNKNRKALISSLQFSRVTGGLYQEINPSGYLPERKINIPMRLNNDNIRYDVIVKEIFPNGHEHLTMEEINKTIDYFTEKYS